MRLFEERGAEAGLGLVRVKNKFAAGGEELVGGLRDVMVCVLFTGRLCVWVRMGE